MSETISLLRGRAERYRAQAREIRAKAVNYPAEIKAAFFRIALYWEQLAHETEARYEKQAAASPQDPPPLQANELAGESVKQSPA